MWAEAEGSEQQFESAGNDVGESQRDVSVSIDLAVSWRTALDSLD
jgi:hypothetical protein